MLSHTITEHTVTEHISVVVQGPDFAVANINLTGNPGDDVDLDAEQLAALIADLNRAAQVLEAETPVNLWPAA